LQGGFLPYSKYRPKISITKFENIFSVPTYNFNGNTKGVERIVQDSQRLQCVGKNICHTVEFYDWFFYDKFNVKPRNRAEELFIEAGNIYFGMHGSKKFHDPTAAVLHLHPEIGTWYNGKPLKISKKQNGTTTEFLDYIGKMPSEYYENGWTTQNWMDTHKVLADIDYDKLWDYITNFK
jgi:hypothetical protein